MASIRSVAALRARNPLPEGTLSVGAGFLIAGIALYGFQSIAAHALGPVRYAPLANFWSLLFTFAPGVFIPLEQEVGRALSARRTRGQGGRPLVVKAAALGVGMAVLLSLGAILAAAPIATRLFGGERLLVWALVAGFFAYCVEHLTRGTLLGNTRFRPYGLLLGSEGLLRVLLCALLAVAGVKLAGLFGFALVMASYLAVVVAVLGRRGLLRPGPPAAWAELSWALGFLLVSSVLTQFLLSIGTVVVQLLAKPSEQVAAGQFLTARVLAYIPIYLLQAVQAPLLPKLSRFAARGELREFRHALLQLLYLIAALGVAAIAGFGILGPLAARLLFGHGFELGSADYALLATSCAGFMVAQVLNQALVALAGYPRATAAWTAGATAFVLVALLGSKLFLRVELGLVAGAAVTVAVMAALLWPLLTTARMRRAAAHTSADEVVGDELVEEVQAG